MPRPRRSNADAEKPTERVRGKLSPELQAIIVSALRRGHFRDTAATLAGISAKTLSEWIRKGDEDQDGSYGEFSRAAKLAMAEAEDEHLDLLRENAVKGMTEVRTELSADGNVVRTTRIVRKDPQASMWYLERMHPTRWGKRATVDLDAAVDTTVVLHASPKNPPELPNGLG